MIWQYTIDFTHILKDLSILIERNLIYEEQLIAVLDRMDQVLRMKIFFPLVKILWKDQSYEEVTQEREEDV